MDLIRSSQPSVRLVPATPGRFDQVQAVLERSSDESLTRRFHSPAGDWTERQLRRLVEPTSEAWSLLACVDGEAHGLGTLAVGRDGEAEVALLVEDDWQRHGLGRALAGGLVALAAEHGIDDLVAYVQGGNRAAMELFSHLVPGVRSRYVDGVAEFRVPVPTAARRERTAG
ncbi:MAG TPA: GNAT family N-acetyltransferase [Microthrixaceae bacterium]|nr:GNAT family N-acetyltransferase [Microthrixaceae bacterium]